MSASAESRRENQSQRAIEFLDEHPGGVTSRVFASAVFDDSEHGVQGVIGRLRRNATEIGRTITYLEEDGEWIIGWAETREQHEREHFKRRRRERAALRLSIEMLTESVEEQPNSSDMAHQLLSARQRLETVDLEMTEIKRRIRRLSEH